MQRRVERPLREIELATTAASQLLGHPIAMQRAVAQDREQHPVDVSLNLSRCHTTAVYA